MATLKMIYDYGDATRAMIVYLYYVVSSSFAIFADATLLCSNMFHYRLAVESHSEARMGENAAPTTRRFDEYTAIVVLR